MQFVDVSYDISNFQFNNFSTSGANDEKLCTHALGSNGNLILFPNTSYCHKIFSFFANMYRYSLKKFFSVKKKCYFLDKRPDKALRKWSKAFKIRPKRLSSILRDDKVHSPCIS